MYHLALQQVGEWVGNGQDCLAVMLLSDVAVRLAAQREGRYKYKISCKQLLGNPPSRVNNTQISSSFKVLST